MNKTEVISERYTMYIGMKVAYHLDLEGKYSKSKLDGEGEYIHDNKLGGCKINARNKFKGKEEYIKLNSNKIDRIKKGNFIHTVIYDEYDRVIYYKVERILANCNLCKYINANEHKQHKLKIVRGIYVNHRCTLYNKTIIHANDNIGMIIPCKECNSHSFKCL